MTNKKPLDPEKTAREISEEFLTTLKNYFAIFISLILALGMLFGFVVLYW
jgi:hypothetical protein